MNNLLYALLCSSLIAGLSMPTFADGHRKGMSPEKRIEQRIEDLKKNLALTDDQIAQIKTILDQSVPKPDTRLTPAERKAKFDEVETKIIAILTPDQKSKYDQYKSEFKTKTKTEFHAKAVERLKNDLKLTNDQTEKVSKILATYQDDIMKVVKNDPKLSESKEQFAAARNQRNEALEAVLTDEQMKQFKKRHAVGPAKDKPPVPEGF